VRQEISERGSKGSGEFAGHCSGREVDVVLD